MADTKQIVARTPRRRSQEEVQFSDGSREIRCYSPANPHYYKDGDGAFHAIDVSVVSEKGSGVGAAKLRSQNVVSAGVRADGNLFKAVGLRPDFSQAKGDHQLEFTLVSVSVDGVDQDIAGKVKAPELSAKSSIAWDMGRYQVITNRRFCRQAVLLDRPKESFRIEFLIHAKGFSVTPVDAKGRSCWHVRDNSGEVDWMISEPLILDENLDIIGSTDYCTHFMTDNSDGTFTYVKESVPGADFGKLPDQFWVDVSTAYSSTADGMVFCTGATWSSVHDATTGTNYESSAEASRFGVLYESGLYGIYRVFLYFDLSGISGIASGVTLSIYSEHEESGDVTKASILQGSQSSTLSTLDYDAFSGEAYKTQNLTLDGFSSFIFNATGIAGINNALGDTAKLCLREYDYDVLNSAGAAPGVYLYLADTAGASNTYDPCLSITLITSVENSLDALTQKSGIAQISGMDSLVEKTGATSSILDGLLETDGMETTAGLDGFVGIGFKTTSLKANLVFPGDESLVMDGVIQRQSVASTGLSASLTQDMGISAGLNGLLRETFTHLTDLHGLAQALVTVTAWEDACVQSPFGNAVTGVHGFMQTSASVSSGIDACPSDGTVAVQAHADAAVLDVVEIFASLDGIAVFPRDAVIGMDAVTVTGTQAVAGISGCLATSGTSGVWADGLLVSGFLSESPMDAVVMATPISVIGYDGILVVEGATGTIADGAIQSGSGDTCHISGCLEMASASNVDADACLSVTSGAVSDVDVVVSADTPITGEMDACAEGGSYSSIVADGLLMVYSAAPCGVDAMPFSAMAVRCAADGCMAVNGTAAAAFDGAISASGGASAELDGLLMAACVPINTIPSACLEGTAFTQAVMDASMISVFNRLFLMDAVLKKEGAISAGIDAVIAGRRIPPGATANEIVYARPRVKEVAAGGRTRTMASPIRVKIIYHQS